MDFDNQADRAWLLGVQRKLYRWSKETPEGAYGDVWNWVTDPRNLRCAWHSIAHNKGRRTPGIDGLTVAKIAAGNGGVPLFLDRLREALRSGSYRPSPVRRKWIPKPGCGAWLMSARGRSRVRRGNQAETSASIRMRRGKAAARNAGRA